MKRLFSFLIASCHCSMKTCFPVALSILLLCDLAYSGGNGYWVRDIHGKRRWVTVDEEPAAKEDPFTVDDPDVPGLAAPLSKKEYLKLREQQIMMQRGLPHNLSYDPRQLAVDQLNRDEARQRARFPEINQTSWTPIGPAPIPNGRTNTVINPVSGRVTAIDVDPTNANIAYVGTADGGLYRTTDGGTTWTPLMDLQSTLAIGAVTIDPLDHTKVFVGTGEGNLSMDSFFGVGLYRIDNANGSFAVNGPFETAAALCGTAAQVHTFAGTSISRIAVDPTNDNRIYVGNTLGESGFDGSNTCCGGTNPASGFLGLYFSGNALAATPQFSLCLGGAAGFNGTQGVQDVVFEPGSTNRLLITVRDFGGVGKSGTWRATNAAVAPGSSPTLTRVISPGNLVAHLAINKVGAVVTVYDVDGTTNGRINRSIDGGATWALSVGPIGFCGAQCFYDIPVAVDPTDPTKVYIGGSAVAASSRIFAKSTDSGATFAESDIGLHADSHAIAIAPNATNVIYEGNDGGIFKSTDSGSTWTSLNNSGFNATQFESLALHPTDASFMIGGTQDNGTPCFGACGTGTSGNWIRADVGDGGSSGIDQSATGIGGTVLYHTYFNQTNNLLGVARVDDPANASDGNWFFSGCNGGVPGNGINCTDGVLFYAPIALGPGSPNMLYYGSDRLYRSVDKGANFSVVSQAPLVAGQKISAIGISPLGDNVRCIGTTNGRVWSTTTGSSILTDITKVTAPAMPAKYVARCVFDPNNINTAYVTFDGFVGNPPLTAGQSHIYKTTNFSGGAGTWVAIGVPGSVNGLPDVPVNAFVVDPANSNLLYAGTDIGVYRSTDAGTNWASYSNGLPRVAVFDLGFQAKSRILRAATHGRGIFEIGPFSPGNRGTLTVTKSGGNVTLSWDAACSFRASDYEIYQGNIDSYYSHTKQLCTTAGLTSSTFAAPAGSVYFLVTPRDGQSEGSYGTSSAGAEIPAASGANQCFAQVTPVSCN